MHSGTRHLLVLALILSASGCSDPKAPNEANFRKLIEAKLAARPMCDQEGFSAGKVGETRDFYPGNLPQPVKDLEAAGVISIKEIPTPPNASPFLAPGAWHRATIENATGWQDGQGFCYATQSLEKIVHWTEPASVQGITITNVTYRWKLVPEKWAPASLVKSHFTKMEGEGEVALVLNNDGWEIVKPQGLFN